MNLSIIKDIKMGILRVIKVKEEKENEGEKKIRTLCKGLENNQKSSMKIEPNPQSPIPNPQSPIPNPHPQSQ
jgi:hypothetical protein